MHKKLALTLLPIICCVLFITTVILHPVHAQNQPFQNDAFKKKIQQLVNDNAQGINQVSIYAYDFGSKTTYALNENYSYMPASLTKVPLMMGFYKIAQYQPDTLQTRFTFSKDITNEILEDQNIQPEKEITPEHSYTVDELINSMIMYSDNAATDVLTNNTTEELMKAIFKDLSNINYDSSNAMYTIKIKDYAKFFIALYDESFLDHTYSQKALHLLKQSAYKDGLVAGIPATIEVAHKFGERRVISNKKNIQSINQFHECGIVYYPKKPYLLCVMSDGNSISDLSVLTKKLSQLVYEEVNNFNRFPVSLNF